MRRKIYRAVAVATVMACIIMAFLTWYCVGVVERSYAAEVLENRVNIVSDMLYQRTTEYENTIEQVYDDYKSKARAFAMLISENTDVMRSETQLEELRMMLGADVITITDKSMNTEYTTGSGEDEPKIYDEFKAAVNDTVFSEALLDTSDDMVKVIAGCSRLDKKGIIQLEFVPENIEMLLNFSDVSKMLTDIPVMKSGSLAIIDDSTMNYISHTDKKMIGRPSYFNLHEDFINQDYNYDCTINGEDVMMQFNYNKNKIVIGYIPYSEIYKTRNDTIIWVISAALIISTVVTLTVRNKILKISRKKGT